MLRTNTNKAMANTMEYLKQDTDYLVNEYDYTGTTEKDFANFIYDTFYDEKIKNIKSGYLARYSMYDLFEDWGKGLALGCTFDYFVRPTAKEILAEILEETEEEKNRYTEAQAENMLTKMIYKTIKKYR